MNEHFREFWGNRALETMRGAGCPMTQNREDGKKVSLNILMFQETLIGLSDLTNNYKQCPFKYDFQVHNK